MDLPNLKELKAILKLCRSQGVEKITLGAMAIEFGEMPYEVRGGEKVALKDDEDPTLPSDEELAYYSAPAYVNDDPLEARLKEQQ